MIPKNCRYLFIDESGDPNFFGKSKKLLIGHEGYQPLLIIGLIVTEDRRALRKSVLSFRDSILVDPLYRSIPSIQKSDDWLPHARGDHPEIRSKFFEHIRSLEGYKAHIIIGRKDIDIFSSKHNSKPQEFYFDLLYHLLSKKLTKSVSDYHIYLAHRQKTGIPLFKKAVDRVAIELDRAGEFKYDLVKSSQYPELSIVDYLIWALQRYIFKNEARFFQALEDIPVPK